MKAVEREQAVELRIIHQLGYGEIARRLKVSKSTLSRWLGSLPLSEERILELRRNSWSKGEAKRERFRQTMREKRDRRDREVYVQQRLRFTNIARDTRFVAGLMLYVAEGDKKSRYEIAFTNTDPVLVSFFASWLGEFLGISRDKVKIQLHLYETMDIVKEELFWMQSLRLQQNQLCRSRVKQLRPRSFSYRDSIRHGTCKLYICSGEKKTELMLSIQAFFDTYEERARSSVGRATA